MTSVLDPVAPAQPVALPESVKPKVLIIDDDYGPRESLRILLKYDYDVLVAGSVADGMALLRTNLVDTIIMDNRMPGRTGMEGLLDVREIDTNVAVIMLTGYGTLETACEAFRNQATDFMTKPPDTDAMLEAVARNIEVTRVKRARDSVSKELAKLNINLSSELNETRTLAKLGQQSDEIIHDLGNPLTILTCCVDLLQTKIDEMKPGAGSQWMEALGYIQMIKKSIEHCCGLADTWRQLRDNISQDRSPTPAREFLIEAVNSTRQTAAISSVALTLEFVGEANGRIEIDPVQMRRVAHNLIVNAIQATAGKRGSVHVEGKVADGKFHFSVADNGVGIPANQLAMIFEPYFSTKAEGTGLGLAISRRIVEEHGGKLHAESEAGSGATFFVRLPMVP